MLEGEVAAVTFIVISEATRWRVAFWGAEATHGSFGASVSGSTASAKAEKLLTFVLVARASGRGISEY